MGASNLLLALTVLLVRLQSSLLNCSKFNVDEARYKSHSLYRAASAENVRRLDGQAYIHYVEDINLDSKYVVTFGWLGIVFIGESIRVSDKQEL